MARNLPEAIKDAKAAVKKITAAIQEAEAAAAIGEDDPKVREILEDASKACNDLWGGLKDIAAAIRAL
ncbi:MAG: hypothetical protein OXG39_07665 [Chloroflexi bacterium]|nr:hypothetical protein [Chloroflexota bacterium]